MDFFKTLIAMWKEILSIASATVGSIICSMPDSILYLKLYIPVYLDDLFPCTIDIALQRLAWTIAVAAGFVAIVNGTKTWFKKCPEEIKLKKKEKEDETE